jgi:predicted esterase
MSENEIDPNELTSPGTVHDPALEERRAREAAEREAESRASSETKFDELAHELERERAEAARAVGDVPEPKDD